jgi:coproporphyrinogen III oxidase
MNMDRDAVKAYLTDLQERIVNVLEQTDGHTFLRDAWRLAFGRTLNF